MNKRAKRKAFFICLAICLMYASVTLKITERLNIRRVSDGIASAPQDMGISVPLKQKQPEQEKITSPQNESRLPPSDNSAQIKKDDSSIEPSFFISVPIVCYAINNRLIERDVLIPSCNNNWKKPIEILQEKDMEGLKNIAKSIGKKNLSEFLKKEGIKHSDDVSAEDIITGKGYTIDKKQLLSIYNEYVGDGYKILFPITANGMEIVKKDKGYELTRMKVTIQGSVNESDWAEWSMPNLINLPIRVAIERLSAYSSKIKVYGSGTVTDQHPKPLERTKGETECIIYGRVNN